jgi:hypothetical protein
LQKNEINSLTFQYQDNIDEEYNEWGLEEDEWGLKDEQM